ncbi:nuclear transport factor 2 family protein [Nitrospina watsonii]|uniref:SnoaL-like domain-containing protein n=1 Tax=Nitrospina watsonii TaxID=1323948 RepID=A0ABM9HGI6_9BACT|nr:nuclear transport factor 2 family protein [Nitrospina watsonii]CAI2719303.1 SnoaL-like domain-containing protein [Nitrospina watsonii]
MKRHNRLLPLLVAGVFWMVTAGNALAADTDALSNVLKKVDQAVCTQPRQMFNFYSPDMVIINDDKRVLPEIRIKNYEVMISEFQGLKCEQNRTVLSGNIGDQVGFLLVDELISVTSRLSTDERQHSVCTYVFAKNSGQWKITHEHCSSLPDYTIVPGDDALYYFHNPVY